MIYLHNDRSLNSTLKIDGNLNASSGMTLQSILGNGFSGESNLLLVTGTATLSWIPTPNQARGGLSHKELIVTCENDISLTYSKGNNFTLLFASGGLATNLDGTPYQFKNLPAGYYSTHEFLPDGTPLYTVNNSLPPSYYEDKFVYSPDLPPLGEGLSQNYAFPIVRKLRMAA